MEVLDILLQNVGKRVLVILDRNMGYEGVLKAVSYEPPSIWLSDAEAVVLRATFSNPIPKVVNRIKRSEIFINLSSILRVEISDKNNRE